MRSAEDALCVQLAGAGPGAVGGGLLANKQGAGGQGLGSQGAAGQVCGRNQTVPLVYMLPPSGHSIYDLRSKAPKYAAINPLNVAEGVF